MNERYAFDFSDHEVTTEWSSETTDVGLISVDDWNDTPTQEWDAQCLHVEPELAERIAAVTGKTESQVLDTAINRMIDEIGAA